MTRETRQKKRTHRENQKKAMREPGFNEKGDYNLTLKQNQILWAIALVVLGVGAVLFLSQFF